MGWTGTARLNRHLAIVSAAFTWAGVLLGLPSLSALLYFLWALVGMRSSSLKEGSSGNPDPNSLIGLLVGAAHLAGKALSWFVNGAEWAVVALTVFSMLLLTIALVLFAVGRGVHAHQQWARILGMMLASAFLLAGAAGAVMFRQVLTIAAASAFAATSMYIFWALWREFA